jgi:tRNA 2-selenouridine synthase
MGEQVIDLEKLANHKGSAFGALGQPEQPRNEHFENMLAALWCRLDRKRPVWVENESRSIGIIKIPDAIYDRMRDAVVAEIILPGESRLALILSEYAVFPVDQLSQCTLRLEKRLGNLRMKMAVELLEKGNLREWALMLMEYYDKFYDYNNSLRDKGSVFRFEFQGFDCGVIASRLAEWSAKRMNGS